MSQPQEAVFKQDLDSTICKNSLANNMASQGSVSKEVQKSCPQVQRELRLVRGIWPPVLHHWSRTICQRQSRISGICPARSACKLAGLPQPKSDSSTNNDSHQRQEPWKERLIYRSRILQGSWQKSKGRVKSRILFRPRAPNLRIFKRAAETVHCSILAVGGALVWTSWHLWLQLICAVLHPLLLAEPLPGAAAPIGFFCCLLQLPQPGAGIQHPRSPMRFWIVIADLLLGGINLSPFDLAKWWDCGR